MRKPPSKAGFAVSDRIVLSLVGNEALEAVVKVHGSRITDEVLATSLDLQVREGDDQRADRDGQRTEHMQRIDLDGITAYVAITRIQ